MTGEVLAGGEVLFRSIRSDEIVINASGWRLSSAAFNDPGKKPSVDRAAIRPDPSLAKKSVSQGVASLLTEEVRTRVQVLVNPTAPPGQQVAYKVNVFARPIPANDPSGQPENPAHAQIESSPEFASNTHFNKLKDKLARIAELRGLVLQPEGVDVTNLPLARE